MRIGFVSIWFERGQAYVTQTLRKALMAAGVPEQDLFVLARTGGVYGRPVLDTDDQWAVPNLQIVGDYHISKDVLQKWVTDNQLDVVVFNEEYDWALVRAAKATGVKVVTYLDFYKEDWAELMGLYDEVWCASDRTKNLVADKCNANHIGWAVDLELFKPKEPEYLGTNVLGGEPTEAYKYPDPPSHLFFHNAGWYGINFRKGSLNALVAFEAVVRQNPKATMLMHEQVPLSSLVPPKAWDQFAAIPGITWRTETVRAPGLYHEGACLVLPSKLEGLGLPLFEALACGLPVICSDIPPFNEYVQPGVTGWLVPIAERHMRADAVAFPEEIVDTQALASIMGAMAEDYYESPAGHSIVDVAGRAARKWAEENLQLKDLGHRLLNAIN